MKKFYSKIIDFIFYNESEIRKAVVESRIDITRPELKNGSGISDPTARDAIRNLMPISQITICGQVIKFPERWLIVVEKTYSWCKRQSETHFQAVHRHYLGGYYRQICFDLSISAKTFYNLLTLAKQYAALQAAQMRLIYID